MNIDTIIKQVTPLVGKLCLPNSRLNYLAQNPDTHKGQGARTAPTLEPFLLTTVEVIFVSAVVTLQFRCINIRGNQCWFILPINTTPVTTPLFFEVKEPL